MWNFIALTKLKFILEKNIHQVLLPEDLEFNGGFHVDEDVVDEMDDDGQDRQEKKN